MPIEEILENYFKPEVRNRGREDFAKELGFISNGSDTQIQGFVKAMPPLKVLLTSAEISSEEFMASCTCSASAKGVLCKHIWTILLLVEKKYPDFLSSKKSIELEVRPPIAESPYKTKQADFKQQQYQKQKQWVKDKKAEQKRKLSAPPRERYSDTVERALDFFSQNGFPMENIRDEEHLKNAMKNLARVFHPDKGGSHDEAVILNNHYATLARFLANLPKRL